ncbi:hypothetical protein JCM11641_004249 [Rhodosporidiobolus odoratus]
MSTPPAHDHPDSSTARWTTSATKRKAPQSPYLSNTSPSASPNFYNPPSHTAALDSPSTNPSPFTSKPLTPRPPALSRRLSSEIRAAVANEYKTAVAAMEVSPGKRRKSVLDVEDATEGMRHLAARRRSSLTPIQLSVATRRAPVTRFTPPQDDVADLVSSPKAMFQPISYYVRATARAARTRAVREQDEAEEAEDDLEAAESEEGKGVEESTTFRQAAVRRRVSPPSLASASPFPPPFLSLSMPTSTNDSFSNSDFPRLPTLFPETPAPIPPRRLSTSSSYDSCIYARDDGVVKTPSTFELHPWTPSRTGCTSGGGDPFAEAFGFAALRPPASRDITVGGDEGHRKEQLRG